MFVKYVSLSYSSMHPFVVAGIFFVALEALFSNPSFFIWGIILGAEAAYLFILYKNPRVLILPMMVLVSMWGGMEFYLSYGPLVRQIIIAGFTIIFFLFHFNSRVFHRSDVSRKDFFYLLNFVGLLLFMNTLFFLVDSDTVSYWALIASVPIGGGAIAFNLFYLHKRERPLFVLVFALISLEFFWLISFWPFFYLTSAGILAILYYSLWRASIESLEERLTFPFLLRTASFSLFLIGTLLILTPWLPL